MNEPKVGQYLYATCAGDNYGKIVAVGQDANGTPIIDIEVFDLNELLDYDDDVDWPEPVLTQLEVPAGLTFVLRNLQYEMIPVDWEVCSYLIRCNTPGNGCFRCTKQFMLNDHK